MARPLSCTTLVFVNGRFSPALSTQRALPGGVVVASLASVLETDPGLVDPYFTRCAPCDRQAFTALNTAFAVDGAVVYVPANVVLAEPVHVLYYSTAPAPIVTFPRTIIVAGDNSQGKIIETYAGRDGERYFTDAVTEIVGGENSHLEHYRVQRESLAAFHVSSTFVYLERTAVFAQQSFTLGGAITRNDIAAKLDGEGVECTVNGLYLGNGDRLVDNHTAIDHAKPHCASHEIYKGMLDGRARGVFNGKIFVRQDAQKTDAKQTNQVLLLSDEATINTKPQLEIFADDVKCTHGATVGQIDADALFYLRARGIGEDEARAMLVHAFASDIIDRVTIEPLRESLESTLLAYLPRT
jgi:Fe-S cluster assembly protein SufD